ncbi:GNAT family N-acetyltransferase [Allonocardiopsis opalescens]|uniref:Ribosomal protein S18 acetylase RimI-like enzyme n=1 Tax=Allonocardiopsis opalescens TaxID=1144618 RepID=A0A2T0Q7H0_9ACTN|nr:GNAT family N-acetyltransferase [Allonocardiopsis opalescens]PRX99780.1 ribosomal protein S18 acetylase RimI-like enzyme [Allonocardiopsis opalescens]
MTQPDIVVRDARAEDEPELLTIDQKAWTPASGFPSLGTPTAFFDDDNPPDCHLVAEADGAVAGYIRLKPVTRLAENRHVLGVFGLAVAEAARGRGVGGALLDAAERRARAKGHRKLSLRVLGTNTGAVRLYERHGYLREGLLVREFVIEDRYVDDLLMGKWLD